MAQKLEVKTDTDKFTLKGRSCELSAFAFVPPKRNEPPERTVFNTPKNMDYEHQDQDRYPNCTYDRLFRKEFGFNNKLHRDDREHAKSRGLVVNDEEQPKDVPTLSSTEYGHRIDMATDHPDRKHVRIARVKAEFFRRNGITS
ncbi:cilia- and flagella-associated protein 90-like isoform X1 [Mytilus trossulus]|uniref:cilia- and flagella-associated protein 90-like isoform X1 n=1 Tax=Mytilus trossulus TaxID=6551 RepID=UPI003005814B